MVNNHKEAKNHEVYHCILVKILFSSLHFDHIPILFFTFLFYRF